MNQVKIKPGPFVEHIRIEAFRTKQADPGYQLLTLSHNDRQFRFKFGHLTFDHGPADQAKLATHGMKAEIAKRRNRNCGRDQAAKKGFFSLAGSGSMHFMGPKTLNYWSLCCSTMRFQP